MPTNRAPNRLLDEFARVMTDAAGTAQGMRREVETLFRTQGELAMKARMENEALKKRLADLEAKMGGGDGAGL